MKKFLLFLLFVAGCSGRELDDRIPEIVFDDSGPPHPCIESELDTDVNNCGFCGNVCSPADSDSCRSGVCVCGLGNICPSGTDCRSGRCYSPDLSGKICEFDDVCPAGMACIESHCTMISCEPEECDGFDNDCDGVIDSSGGLPLSSWCYDGVSEFSMLSDPCHPGVKVCVGGVWTECMGDVAPVDEVGTLTCDSIDNNCDGCIDGVLHGDTCDPIRIEGFDVIFAIDTSGSMSDEIDAVKTAIQSFSMRFRADTAFRFGIVAIPHFTSDEDVHLYLNLSDFATFETAITSFYRGSGGYEPSYDAVYVMGSELADLPITWRTGTIRIIILFTDESAQSYRMPLVDETTMCNSLIHGEVLAVFTPLIYFEDWDECGTMFELTNNSTRLLDDLNTIITDPCI